MLTYCPTTASDWLTGRAPPPPQLRTTFPRHSASTHSDSLGPTAIAPSGEGRSRSGHHCGRIETWEGAFLEEVPQGKGAAGVLSC